MLYDLSDNKNIYDHRELRWKYNSSYLWRIYRITFFSLLFSVFSKYFGMGMHYLYNNDFLKS